MNLHWSTANVNTIVDSCQDISRSLVVSKDAKSIVPTDIAPVQHPGPSWRRRELPDHSWDQSRLNAITPMTFLFLQTRVEQGPTSTLTTLDLKVSESTILHLTRTGQTVTLLNLSFFEPDTTFKCLNEICYLLSMPELDTFFRDSATNNLKKEFIFVVDNGPAEQPSSSLVQMCLARLLNFLKLEKLLKCLLRSITPKGITLRELTRKKIASCQSTGHSAVNLYTQMPPQAQENIDRIWNV